MLKPWSSRIADRAGRLRHKHLHFGLCHSWGPGEEASLNAIQGRFELFTSVPILTETTTVLQSKFDWAEEKTRELVQAISRVASVVRITSRLHVVEDEPDNRIIECAIHARADFIVTGDRHLLSLNQYKDVPMIRLAAFLELLKGSEGIGG
jgi:putative PIN family toxin of toxin-antitoxin system